MGYVRVDGGDTEPAVAQAVAVVINTNVVAACIAAHIVDVGASEGECQIVETGLHGRILLQGVEEFVKTFGSGGVSSRHGIGNDAEVDLVHVNVPLQQGLFPSHVQLPDDIAFQVRIVGVHSEIVQTVFIDT